MTKHRLSRGWINNYLVAAHFQLQWQQLDLDHKLDHLDICRMSRGWLVTSHPKSRWRPASLNITFTQIRHPIQEYQVFQMVVEAWRIDHPSALILYCRFDTNPTTVLIRLELSHVPIFFLPTEYLIKVLDITSKAVYWSTTLPCYSGLTTHSPKKSVSHKIISAIVRLSHWQKKNQNVTSIYTTNITKIYILAVQTWDV
jgi:hypothetical protein